MRRVNLLEGLSDNIVIDKDKCTACGICVDTCILDNLRLELSPCRRACPLDVNCQGYVQLIARGKEAEALTMLREKLPFAGILSRICSQPCEADCQRRQTDGEAVAIRALKRYLVDQAAEAEIPLPDMQSDSNKKVAIIGSGPAGMMAAHDLRCHGHAVTVFETEAAPGGMLRNAIPEFRLSQDILEKELALLRRMGIKFQCGAPVGQDVTVESLQGQFEAMVVACGCSGHVTLGSAGENLAGVYYGLPFLRAARGKARPVVGKEVVVIGGGNVAVDAAQTALRLGAHKVSLVCLES
ncbi:MAG: FAD-dependent oxidoreductase, partial [Desulfobacterales bacterium]